MKRLALLVPMALAASLGHALTLTTPLDLGDPSAPVASPNGDSFIRNAPTLIAPGSTILTEMASQVDGFYASAEAPPTVTLGGAIAGEASVRKLDTWLPPGGDRYYVGANFRLDYIAPDQPDLRWLLAYSFRSQGSAAGSDLLFTEAFQNEQPFFYPESSDLNARSDGTYRIDSGIASLRTPGTYDWDVYATLATVARDNNGVVTRVLIHDGVHLSGTAVLRDPVPEPATLAALGVGLAALARRRRR